MANIDYAGLLTGISGQNQQIDPFSLPTAAQQRMAFGAQQVQGMQRAGEGLFGMPSQQNPVDMAKTELVKLDRNDPEYQQKFIKLLGIADPAKAAELQKKIQDQTKSTSDATAVADALPPQYSKLADAIRAQVQGALQAGVQILGEIPDAPKIEQAFLVDTATNTTVAGVELRNGIPYNQGTNTRLTPQELEGKAISTTYVKPSAPLVSTVQTPQQKVEENNFGVRKRLLEYDDVMNAQREVVYKRRRHALFGERLKLDIANMMYDTCEIIVNNNKLSGDFKNFEFELIRYFSITSPVSEGDFLKMTDIELTGKTYKAALAYYTEKAERSAREAYPIIKNVFEEKTNHFERIVIPFSDGIKSLEVITDLKRAYETQGKQLVADFEKNITLAIVDEAWKKHLRKMDELKQSVQLAVHEQKDPLLIYKFEAFNLFSNMINGVNKEVISFLFKGDLPQQNAPRIQEAKEVRKKENYKISKEEIVSSESANREAGETQQRQITETIVREMPKINRNDTVTIQNVANGQTQEMKFKKAESLIANGTWVLVQ
jgi:hypothetical protein